MEITERLLDNKDWISLLLLGVVFLLVAANTINARRLKQLFALPYNDFYLINFSTPIWHAFNVLLFIASNIILGLFIYLLVARFYPDKTLFTSYIYIKILGFIFAYWSVKYLMGKFVAYLFGIEKWQKKLMFIKISYFFSSSLYLFFFVVFAIYFFNQKSVFLDITIGFYSMLLLIRYFHFLRINKTDITSNLFYFILYLCALEIAPLFIAIKIGT